MKKVLALVIVVIMLASMTPLALAAPEYIGEVTVALPGFGGLEFTLSNAGSTYSPATDFGYGLSTMVYGEPGSTITFNQDVTFGLMGADAGAAAAGEATVIDTIDGCYVYAPDMSQYVIFLTPNNPSGQYTEDSMTAAITDVAAGAAAPAEAPAEAPAASGDAAALPAELANAFPVGVWPLAAGTYDPALDEVAVPAGATLYGLFDAAYAVIADPATVTGFEQVDDIAALADGTWFLIVGSSGFNYIAIMTEGGFAAGAEAPAAVEEAPAAVEEAPAAAAPAAAAAEVYVTIVANGAVQVAAQPVVPARMTFDSAMEKAHELFYEGGAAGFAAGIDATYNMMMISKVWGTDTNPYQVINDVTSMADDPVKPGDNLILSIGTDFSLTLKATPGEADGTIDIKATKQTLDFTTFSYAPSPFGGEEVKLSDGTVIGATDDKGMFTIAEADIPEDGVLIFGNNGAINVLTSVQAPTVLDVNAKTVFLSVSIGGQFAVSGINKIAALPVTVTISENGTDERTLEGVIRKAHATYYSSVPGELQGYDSTQFWGIPGAGDSLRILYNDKEVKLADAANITISANDNIILSLSRDTRVTPELVYVDYFINGSIAIGTVYTVNPDGSKTIRVGAPLVAGDGEGTAPSTALTDPNGSVLATDGVVSDAEGYFEVTLLPGDREGILAVAGLYASNTNNSGYYPLFKGPDGRSLLVCLVVGLGASIPLLVIVILAQRSEIKNRGLKMSKYKLASSKANV